MGDGAIVDWAEPTDKLEPERLTLQSRLAFVLRQCARPVHSQGRNLRRPHNPRYDLSSAAGHDRAAAAEADADIAVSVCLDGHGCGRLYGDVLTGTSCRWVNQRPCRSSERRDTAVPARWSLVWATALAAAKQLVCSTCLEDRLIPVSVEQGFSSSVSTLCLTCKRAVEPVFDTIASDSLDFMQYHAETPLVPRDSGETLRDPVASDDCDYLLSQLLNGLAPGPDAVPYELWIGATDALKCIIRDCINTILRGDSPPRAPPPSWLGGLVRFLFKKGDALRLSCYCPVCLLDTAYKILSAILTDHLYRLAERHGQLDASQAVLDAAPRWSLELSSMPSSWR